MAKQLYLNDLQVDIPVDPVVRKLQVNDVGDLGAAKSNFSYTLKLERTARNTYVFDMLATNGNTSRKPYEKITANYIIDGIHLVRNGSAIIRQTSSYFNVNIIDGARTISELLEGLTLADLDLSALDHNLTAQTFIDSFANTEGYIYGIADYGQGLETYTDSSVGAYVAPSETGSHAVPLTVISNEDGGGAKDVTETSGTDALVNAFYNVSTKSGSLDIDIIAIFGMTFGSDGSEVQLRLKQYRASVLHDSRTLGTLTGDTSDESFFNINTDESFSDVAVGDYFILSVEKISGSFTLSTAYYSVRLDIEAYTYLKVENQAPAIFLHTVFSAIFDEAGLTVTGDFLTDTNFLTEVLTLSQGYTINSVGQSISPGDYLAETLQLSIVKDVVFRYGLVLIQTGELSYNFVGIDDIFNGSDFVDWSEKLSTIDSEQYNSGYAQQNKAVYNYAEEATSEAQDGALAVNNVNAQDEKNIFTSIFEIPGPGQTLSGEATYKIPLWNTEGENQETPIKLMRLSEKSITVDAKMLNNDTVVSQTNNIPFLSLENMDFQYFFDTYYSTFGGVIDDYKKITAKILLSPIDIYFLDFTKLVFLKQTGQKYYLNSIRHESEGFSKVEMIQIT